MSQFEPVEQSSQEPQDGEMPPDFNADPDASITVAEPSRPRNNGLLVLMTLVLAGGAAVYFMRLKSGPSRAQASAEATSANATINQFLNDGNKNMQSMHELLKNTEKFVQQFKTDPSATQVKLQDLKTDPFLYSKAAADNTAAEQAKLIQDREKRKAAEKEAILKAVQQLQVQSILTSGKVRTCMINNVMYVEGQAVDSFKIEKINPDGIVVTRGGYRLQMKINR